MKSKNEKNDEAAKLAVYDLKGKVVDHIQLDETLFDGYVNNDLIYEAKKMYEANQRQGTASSKTRAEVAGGGKKPWKQKGTGRARVRSTRNPLWRHGGVAFGPRPRDYNYSMPKKALRTALLSGINARLNEDMLKAVVTIDLKESKTRLFAEVLNHLKIAGKVLVVVDKADEKIKRSSRNIEGVTLKEGRNINVRDVLLNETLMIEKGAFEKLAERLK